mgnify:CR=1 FL=1
MESKIYERAANIGKDLSVKKIFFSLALKLY